MQDKLVILWTTGDKGTAMNMVLMYAKYAMSQGWWKQIELVIWGASAKLVAADEEIRAEMDKCRAEGVILRACKACAQRYNIYDFLVEFGIDVASFGPILTKYIKEGQPMITI